MNRTCAGDTTVDASDDAEATVLRAEEEGTSRRSMTMEMTPIGGTLLVYSPKQQLNRMHADNTAIDMPNDAETTTVPRAEEEEGEGGTRRSTVMEITPIGGMLLVYLTQTV